MSLEESVKMFHSLLWTVIFLQAYKKSFVFMQLLSYWFNYKKETAEKKRL